MLKNRWTLCVLCALLLGWLAAPVLAQAPEPEKKPAGEQPVKPKDPVVPDLEEIVARPPSAFRSVSQTYEADRGSLNRLYTIAFSPARLARMKRFYTGWVAALQKLDRTKLSDDDRAEAARLEEKVRRELRSLDEQAKEQAEIAPLLPFATTIIDLEEARRHMDTVDAARAAGLLTAMKKQIDKTLHAVEAGLKADDKAVGIKADKKQATRAADTVAALRAALKNWFNFYNGYDPVFTWWMAEPYKDADQALQTYATFLRDKISSEKPDGDKAGPAPDSKATDADAPLTRITEVPDLDEILARPRSEMSGVLELFQKERGNRGRFATASVPLPFPPPSPERQASARKVATDWLAALEKLEFDKLSREGRVDYLLLKNHLDHEVHRIDLQAKALAEVERLVPFERAIDGLDEARRKKEKVDPAKAVEALKDLAQQIEQTRRAVEANPISAGSAVRAINRLKSTLKEWFDYSKGADAEFAATAGDAYKEIDQALDGYAAWLRDKFPPKETGGDGGIPGRPIGREALLVELAGEMIPYTPEEILALAGKEFAWCEAEMKKASRALGYGDDWHKAVEKVKTLHVEPGKQPEMIRDLAREAQAFLDDHDLVTVPPLARETWRMEMMSPQRQLVNPFFTGGEVISVSFPTSTMAHEAKLQSMRGNNIPFARATVHHELIPGHHLQGFETARYQTQRGLFVTPFWTEGWALYWEMVLYDMDFPKSPEDRVGFLFWRMHRCARIVFSLEFHLGKMSAQECVDFLVERVGHERDNAAAEVRRSFAGGYGPLYQAAYMLGGLQFRALRKELVDSGRMSNRAFHDAILKEGRMPIEMVRALLTKQTLSRDFSSSWKFYGENPSAADAATNPP